MLEDYARKIEKITEEVTGFKVRAEVILSEHGDITVKTFNLAKELRKSPAEIASEIAEKLKKVKIEEISEIRNVGAYINFFISPKHLAKNLYKNFRKSFPRREEKVLIEHTSANPTGPIHIGRARNPIIGDTIARLLKLLGYETTVEYYVNDMGKQVAMLLAAIKKKGAENMSIDDYTKLYQEAYRNEKEYGEEAAKIMRDLEKCDVNARKFSRQHIEIIMGEIAKTLQKIGVSYDSFVYESDILCQNYDSEVLRKLKDIMKVDENGAKYVEVDGERVYLFRGDGTSLYFFRDILYHAYKAKRCDRMINVLGEDHKSYGKNLNRILRDILAREVEIVYYSFVSLPEGKMSTRAGRVVYLRDVLKEAFERSMEEIEKRYPEEKEDWKKYVAEKIAYSAVRFNILKVQASKPVVFRWEDALNFEGESAPYIMYSYARASSILRKIGKFNEKPPLNLNDVSEIKLIKTLARFRDVVEKTSMDLEVHRIARYAIELADAFNNFYRDCPVIKAEEDKRDERATLVLIFKEIMGKTMEILGIEKLERM